MIVYSATKNIFANDVIENRIEEEIDKRFYQKMGYHTGESERNAWKNSMLYMNNVISDNRIPKNVGIAIEFKVPNTSKRIDFIISGLNINGKNTAIVIELKQWSSAKVVSGKDALVETYTGHALRQTIHPSYQAWTYVEMLNEYDENVQQKEIALYPCAYLHNYEETNPPVITNAVYEEYTEKAPVFMKKDVLKLRDFITKYIKYGDNKETLYLIDNGKIRPSKSLQDHLVSLLKGNKEFQMIDDQMVVYQEALTMARKSYEDGEKRVLIVKGGPGTGKSVLAVNLLVELTKEGMLCSYVTKNRAPRNVYAAKLSHEYKKTIINNLFKGSGSFIDSNPNEYDVLVVDEAHRLNEKSGIFQNKGENQIKEIINASKFSVFFIDEEQRVTTKDIGSIDEIKKFIEEANANYEIMELESQFRCDGSDGYINWIDDVLEIKHTANATGFDLDYKIEIGNTPNELKEKISEKNKINNKARIVAGYCWDWIKEGKNNSDFCDIQIPEYNFAMSWNLGNSETWAVDPNSVNEVGCIHTCQGLEFDYVGVIIGDDLRYENGKVITDYTKRAKTDNSLKGIKKMIKENPQKAKKIADEIIRNTYRTLLTRGQKGCYVYCTDKALSDYLKRRVQAAKEIYYYDKIQEEDLPMVAESKTEYNAGK